MGQVLNFGNNEEYNGVTQISVPAYRTSDGTVYNTKEQADKHEAAEQQIKDLVNNYNRGLEWRHDRVIGGRTMRGYGWEFVHADKKTLEHYTRYVISKIKG